jgi:cytochrome c biogenesis factor
MNKRNGVIILIIAFAMVLYGAYKLVVNQPKELVKTEITAGKPGDTNAVAENILIQNINVKRKMEWSNGIKVLVVGGILVVLGFGLQISSRK